MVKIILLKRKAVAMIELIFAIVVMGFAMLAIPNITAQSAKSSQSAINQEAVAAAAAQMQNILSMQWDKENAETPIGGTITILKTSSVIAKTGINSRTLDATKQASDSSAAKVGTDDMGDYNGVDTAITLQDHDTTQDQDTKQDYSDKKLNMLSTVQYTNQPTTSTSYYNFNPSATPSSVTTDIKRVSVALTSPETSQGNKNVTLNAFSCNIGVPRLNQRQLP